MILAQKKNLRFIEIDKLILKCWGDFSDIILSRIFFQKLAHNREYIKNYCNNLDNEFSLICCGWYQNNILEEPCYLEDIYWFCYLRGLMTSNDFYNIFLYKVYHQFHNTFYIHHNLNLKLYNHHYPFIWIRLFEMIIII